MGAARSTARLRPAAALGSAALIAFAAGGCSSASAPGTRAAASGTAAATVSASASPTSTVSAGLAAKLLTVSDMPSGWSADAAPTNPTMATQCPLLNPSGWDKLLPDRAEADLKAGLAGPYLVEEYAGGGPAQVAAGWQALVAKIPLCTTFTHNAPGGGSTFTIEKAAGFPAYGDDSRAFTLAIDVTGGVSASGDIVVSRTKNAIVSVYVVGISGVQQSAVRDAMAKAVAKAAG